MARISTDLIKNIEKEIEKHQDVFNILKRCGGVLYLTDLAVISDKPVSTLKYQIKKSIELDLLEVLKSPCGKTKRDVVRLTTRAWRKLGCNRTKVTVQDEIIDRCLFKAILNKHLGFVSKKEDLFLKLNLESLKDSVVDMPNKHYKTKSLYDNYSKILSNNKISIKNFILDIDNKNVFLDVVYVTRKLSSTEFLELKELIDMLIGLIEFYCYKHDDNFYSNDNYIKINLAVVTENELDRNEKMREIKIHKRNYHSFTKQKLSSKVDLFYSINFIFDNKIDFMCVDKNTYELIMY